jgi:tRNA A-37 threonylcarbamoyl transferase component Bud32
MKIGNSNNNPAFGSFNAIVANNKEELKTFRIAKKYIKEVFPQTKIRLERTKKTAGFINEAIAFIYKIVGKSTSQELKIAQALNNSGIPVSEILPIPAERANVGMKALTEKAIKAVKQELPAESAMKQTIKAFKPVFAPKTEETIAKGTLTSMHKFDVKY